MLRIIKKVKQENLILDGNIYWHKQIENEKIREKILNGELLENQYDDSLELSEVFTQNTSDKSVLLKQYVSSIKNDDSEDEEALIVPVDEQLEKIYKNKLNSDVFIFIEKTGFAGDDRLLEETNKLNQKIDEYAIIYNDEDIIPIGKLISSKIIKFFEELKKSGEEDS